MNVRSSRSQRAKALRQTAVADIRIKRAKPVSSLAEQDPYYMARASSKFGSLVSNEPQEAAASDCPVISDQISVACG